MSLGGRTALIDTKCSVNLLELKNVPDLSWTKLIGTMRPDGLKSSHLIQSALAQCLL